MLKDYLCDPEEIEHISYSKVHIHNDMFGRPKIQTTFKKYKTIERNERDQNKYNLKENNMTIIRKEVSS